MIKDNSYTAQINQDETNSKFRNNKFNKSRNADVGATLVGLTPSEQEFFNSNREKSPIPGSTNSTVSTVDDPIRVNTSRNKNRPDSKRAKQ